MQLEHYDYADFGGLSTWGGDIARTKFKGENGIVFTNEAAVSDAARSMGNAVSPLDDEAIRRLTGKVRFTIIGNQLERSASFADLSHIITTAISITRSFVYIQTPWFDSDGDLLQAGLKLHWSDWTKHRMPVTSLQLLRAIQPMLTKQTVARAAIFGQGPITSAEDPRILPCHIGRDSGRYDQKIHGEKPGGALPTKAYKHLVCVIARRDASMIERAMVKVGDIEQLYDSANLSDSLESKVASKESKPKRNSKDPHRKPLTEKKPVVARSSSAAGARARAKTTTALVENGNG